MGRRVVGLASWTCGSLDLLADLMTWSFICYYSAISFARIRLTAIRMEIPKTHKFGPTKLRDTIIRVG